MKKITLLIFFVIISLSIFAQELLPDGGGEFVAPKESNCLSDAQRQDIKTTIKKNQEILIKKGVLKQSYFTNKAIVAFDWPLRKTSNLSFFSFYAINNFVDQNTGTGIEDYNCDARSYDGHHGIDIDTWPFPWYLYENDFVEVIAGEAGVIVSRTDGNNDQHCSCIGNWNAIYIQHADGSVAWYGHMKKNSLTSKIIGQSVAKGEYLGVVASSGCSTQPHLHFEVYDDSNNLIDPYSGSCNTLNSSSWWATQPDNREPTLNALLTHDDIPVHGCPGLDEVPHISDTFYVGQDIYLATYYHDQLNGDVSDFVLRRPDNSIYYTWDHASTGTYTSSWWYWIWDLPSQGPFGTWTFELTYKGQTHLHDFEYLNVVSTDVFSDNDITIFPNPAKNNIIISGIQNGQIKIQDLYGRTLIEQILTPSIDISSLAFGIYFISIEIDNQTIVRKIVKE